MVKKIIPYISLILFVVAVIGYAYEAGKKSDLIEKNKDKIEANEKYDKELNTKIDDQIKVTNAVDAKLDLLLIYFHITDSTRYD